MSWLVNPDNSMRGVPEKMTMCPGIVICCTNGAFQCPSRCWDCRDLLACPSPHGYCGAYFEPLP